MALRNYSFQIQTLRDLSDSNSPHILAKFEFLAEDEISAEKYMQSLINHYDSNMPFIPRMPRENTQLISKEY